MWWRMSIDLSMPRASLEDDQDQDAFFLGVARGGISWSAGYRNRAPI